MARIKQATDANTSTSENGFDRLDKNLGMIWSRISAIALFVFGAILLINSVTADNFTMAGYLPALFFIAVVWGLAAVCWRSKRGILDQE